MPVWEAEGEAEGDAEAELVSVGCSVELFPLMESLFLLFAFASATQLRQALTVLFCL